MRVDRNSWIVKVAYPAHPFALAERVWGGAWPKPMFGYPDTTSLCALSWRTAGMLLVHSTIGVVGVVGTPLAAGAIWAGKKVGRGFARAVDAVEGSEKLDRTAHKLVDGMQRVSAWQLWKSLGTLKKKACPIVEIR